MGLIKAFTGSLGGTLADTWKEAIHAGGIDNTFILKQGVKRGDQRSANTKGTADVITNGSEIIVEENMVMLTIDNGEITNIASEPGVYKFNSSSPPSIFDGGLGASVDDFIDRFKHGGVAKNEQRVVYINLQPLPGIPFGTPAPVPYPDPRYNTTIELRFFGTFEIQIKNAEAAVRFYREVAGRANGDIAVTQIFKSEQYKSEFILAMMQALSGLAGQGISYNQISFHLGELTEFVRNATRSNWQRRGFDITSIGMGPVTISDETKELLKDRLKADTMLDPNVQRAMMAGSVGRGIEAAGGNSGGAVNGFMGVNMANMAGAGALGAFGGIAAQPAPGQYSPASQPAPVTQPRIGSGWTCVCGTVNTGKFCTECGKPGGTWTCICGTANKGKFCTECGKPRA